MKKIATKLVLVTASTFIIGTAMAQTDTTKVPVPDTTEVPTDTTGVPTDSVPTKEPEIVEGKKLSTTAQLGKVASSLNAITSKEFLSAKQYGVRVEDEIEA